MSQTATRQEGIEVYETPVTFTTQKTTVSSITDSTQTITAEESGTIFSLKYFEVWLLLSCFLFNLELFFLCLRAIRLKSVEFSG